MQAVPPMARQKSGPAACPRPDSNTAREGILDALNAIANRLQAVTEILDDIYSELQWAIRNDRFRSESPFPALPTNDVTDSPADVEESSRAEPTEVLKPEPLTPIKPLAESSVKQRSLWDA